MLRILLAEDMHLIRGALIALLGLEPDITVVAEVERGDAVLAAALDCRPDVAVIDMGLPGMDGLAAAVQLAKALPECRPLLLTGLGSPGALRRVMDAGFSGILPKHAPPQQFAAAIRRVAAGKRVIDPELAMAAWQHAASPLTERETECLRYAAEGVEAAEIAARLHLSAGTVRNYLTAAVTKLRARNRIDAVRIARDWHWI